MNMVILFPYSYARKPKEISRINETDFWGQTPSLHLLVEGPRDQEIYKLALQFHCYRRSYAFLYYSDLDTPSRCSLKSLESLGNITLYIPNLTDLSHEEVEVLIQLLDSPDKVPSLICGLPVDHHSRTIDPTQKILMGRLSKNHLSLA